MGRAAMFNDVTELTSRFPRALCSTFSLFSVPLSFLAFALYDRVSSPNVHAFSSLKLEVWRNSQCGRSHKANAITVIIKNCHCLLCYLPVSC